MLFIGYVLYTESNNLLLIFRQYVKTFNFCFIYFWSFDKLQIVSDNCENFE